MNVIQNLVWLGTIIHTNIKSYKSVSDYSMLRVFQRVVADYERPSAARGQGSKSPFINYSICQKFTTW